MVVDEFFVKEKVRSKADDAWKETLGFYFKSFMEYCWKTAYDDIDWDKGFEFLEQELQNIVEYPSPLGKRIVDKLIKVWKKGGSEIWILLHIEVQGRKDEDFQERLFIYRYRLHERYRKPIATLAILTDSNASWRPTLYKTEIWGSSNTMKFSILKILDFKDKKDILINSSNPFALVILAQLTAIESGKKQDNMLFKKTSLMQMLYKKGLSGEDIRRLYKFIDGLIVLSYDYKLKYHESMKEIEKECKVSYLTTAEEIGLHKGAEKLLVDQLKNKFGQLPKIYEDRLRFADDNVLMQWGIRILYANTLEDIFS